MGEEKVQADAVEPLDFLGADPGAEMVSMAEWEQQEHEVIQAKGEA
jgi:hypothetical protein